MGTKDTNPKDAVGVRKWRQFCTVPFTVLWEIGVAMLEGARKYGRHNYRVSGVRASVYIDAAMGHLTQWWEGEDLDPESGLNHITKALASLVVLRDAMMNVMYIDDRPPKAKLEAIRSTLQKKVEEVLDRYPDAKPPFTALSEEAVHSCNSVVCFDENTTKYGRPYHESVKCGGEIKDGEVIPCGVGAFKTTPIPAPATPSFFRVTPVVMPEQIEEWIRACERQKLTGGELSVTHPDGSGWDRLKLSLVRFEEKHFVIRVAEQDSFFYGLMDKRGKAGHTTSQMFPAWDCGTLYIRGEDKHRDNEEVRVPYRHIYKFAQALVYAAKGGEA